MASNYPPGVTGNEPEIVGGPECPECDEPIDARDPVCSSCGFVLYTDDDRRDDADIARWEAERDER